MKVVIVYAELPHVSEIAVNHEGVVVTIDKSRVDREFLAPLMKFEIARGKVKWELRKDKRHAQHTQPEDRTGQLRRS